MKFPIFTYRFLSFSKILSIILLVALGIFVGSNYLIFADYSQKHSIPIFKSLILTEENMKKYSSYLIIIFLLASFCELIVGSRVIKERLAIYKDLGLQLETFRINGGVKRQFIDICRVRDIVINEFVTMHHIGQYLAIIVEKQPKLILPFENCEMKMVDLIPIYQNCQSWLYEGK